MHKFYSSGATLEEVGERFGISRQRVQQVFDEAGIDTRSITETHALRHERLLQRSEEVVAAYEKCKDVRRVARQLDIPQALVKEIVAERFPVSQRRRYQRHSRTKYPTEEMVAYLRQASAEVAAPLRREAYRLYAEGRRTDDGRSWPSVHTYTARFGSWRKALIAAGLPVGPLGPSKIKPRFSERDCVDALCEAARMLGEAPTKTAYEEFARASAGELPSAATVIGRLGGWYNALVRAGL